MSKKNKIILITSSILMVVIALVVVFTREVPTTISTSNEKELVATTVNNLRFNDIKIVNNQVSALVQNTKSTNLKVALIKIVLKDSSNNIIDELITYIGEDLEPNEIRMLSAKSNKDLSSVNNIEYQVVDKFIQKINVHTNSENTNDYVLERELGTTIGSIDEPYRKKYFFEGWFKDSNLSIPINEDEVVNHLLTDIYAAWEAKPEQCYVERKSDNWTAIYYCDKGKGTMQNCKYGDTLCDGGYQEPGFIPNYDKLIGCKYMKASISVSYYCNGSVNVTTVGGNMPVKIECECD